MIIEKVAIEKINPAFYNPRIDLKPGDHGYETLKSSMSDFGVLEPLVWNKRTGNLVGGHQRLKILKNDFALEEVFVSVVDLDLEKERELNIALNRIQGGWDMVRLREELGKITPERLKMTGFNESELRRLLGFSGVRGKVDDDALPEDPAIRTKLGQIWAMGEHRLFCGDSTDEAPLDAILGPNNAALVVTDPPYNVDYEGETEKKLKIKNDAMPIEDFKSFLSSFFGNIVKFVNEDGSLYVFHPSRFQREFQNAMEAAGLEIRNQIIWAKNTFSLGWGRYKFKHEPVFYAHLKQKSDNWYGDETQNTVWEIPKPPASRLHPTMKPVELLTRAIVNSSKPNDIVLDPFAGSGSTLIACEKLNRRSYNIELDPKYCDVILQRFEDYTGVKAREV